MLSSPILDETWRAVPANVPTARHVVLSHLKATNISDPPLNDICLACSEAVSNAVIHAYVGRDPGPVRVRVDVGPNEIELTVQDEGTGMAPRADSPGLGVGMPLMATLADRFEVRAPPGGGTVLCMWFNAGPGAATLPNG